MKRSAEEVWAQLGHDRPDVKELLVVLAQVVDEDTWCRLFCDEAYRDGFLEGWRSRAHAGEIAVS